MGYQNNKDICCLAGGMESVTKTVFTLQGLRIFKWYYKDKGKKKQQKQEQKAVDWRLLYHYSFEKATTEY